MSEQAPNLALHEFPKIDSTEHELSALRGLAERHGVDVEFIRNGEAGYVARLERTPSIVSGEIVEYRQDWEGPASMRPIVAVDADDTLFAYTETKTPRADAFVRFAQAELGHQPDAETLGALMCISDEFSRWQEPGSNATMYHIQPHLWALSWATSQLRDVQPENVPAKLDEIKARLDSVKAGQHAEQQEDESAPFHFRKGKLIIGNFIPPESINSVFEPVYEPVPYPDALYDMQEIAEAGVRTVAFTYGEPEFQLDKLLRLRDQLTDSGRGWPYEYIFLTTVPKGEFIEELLNTSANDAQLRQDLFSADPHVFMLVDDDRGQTADFLRAQDIIESSSGARLGVVLSLRERTKSWKKREAAYRDVPEVGLVIDQDDRRGVHIGGRIEDVAAGMSTDVYNAHRDAVSSLKLRIYNQLAGSLAQLANAEAHAELKQLLDPQRDYFSRTAFNMERDIESRHGVPFMTV
ncbi:MAG TPA: hypothetical protein VF809_00820 [Candidatus Saccharimonadales bacterium]